jgi:hypothetical protein
LALEVERCQEIESPYIIGMPLTTQQEVFVGRTDVSAQIERLLLDQGRLPLLTREALTTDPFTCFDEWLDRVEGTLGQRTAPLALDEFEALDRAFVKGRFDEEAILGTVRHLIQHRSCFKVLLAGSHTLDELQRWAGYLINLQTIRIGYLREDEARQLVERPVRDFALRYEPDASQRVLDLTRGHPFLVQLLCAEIVSLKNEQPPAVRRLARLADVEAAAPRALSHGSFFFADIQQNQVDDAGTGRGSGGQPEGPGPSVPRWIGGRARPAPPARADRVNRRGLPLSGGVGAALVCAEPIGWKE